MLVVAPLRILGIPAQTQTLRVDIKTHFMNICNIISIDSPSMGNWKELSIRKETSLNDYCVWVVVLISASVHLFESLKYNAHISFNNNRLVNYVENSRFGVVGWCRRRTEVEFIFWCSKKCYFIWTGIHCPSVPADYLRVSSIWIVNEFDIIWETLTDLTWKNFLESSNYFSGWPNDHIY